MFFAAFAITATSITYVTGSTASRRSAANEYFWSRGGNPRKFPFEEFFPEPELSEELIGSGKIRWEFQSQ